MPSIRKAEFPCMWIVFELFPHDMHQHLFLT